MRVLVTGGLGFIGSKIAWRYRADGHSVVVVDTAESNVVESALIQADGVEVIECSIGDYVSEHGIAEDFDLVVHAASPVGAAGVLRYPDGVAETMVSSIATVARACLPNKIPIVFISSSEVYGLDGVLSETMRPSIPLTHSARVEYALGKLTSEAVLAAFGRRGLEYVCIRPFNVIGARQSRFGGFVLPTFVQQALADLPLTVFGDGSQARAFLCVQDLAEFVVEFAKHDLLRRRTCVNVGNPDNAFSILELAERTIELLGSRSKITFTEGRKVYGPAYVEAASKIKLCDIERARDLGWSPRQRLDAIVSAVGEYYRHHRDTRDSDARG